jgi:hypothetical protein
VHKRRVFDRVRPYDGDVLPFRCEYETTSGAKQTNVGVNYIRSSVDGWWSFADVCKSKILTGRCPEILETIEFIPIGRQTTKVINLFGDPRFKIDLAEGKDDLFTKVIELRTTVQSEKKATAKKYGKASPE